MRGISTGGGGIVDLILKAAPIVFSFLAFLFMAIALSSGSKQDGNYLEGVSIVNVSLLPSPPPTNLVH